MGLGKKTESGPSAMLVGRASFSEGKTPRGSVDTQRPVSIPAGVAPPPGGPHVVVTCGHAIKLCIEFQTLDTSCSISVPVGTDDRSIREGYQFGWAMVREELERQAEWGRDVIRTMVSVKRSTEKR